VREREREEGRESKKEKRHGAPRQIASP